MADCRLYVSPLLDDSEARDFGPSVNGRGSGLAFRRYSGIGGGLFGES
ncbi:hypothetical protein PL10110_330040 [Planktothrix agardhii]|nr:hypothetical protein PL10110_330040 [Planktothrix agardhii]